MVTLVSKPTLSQQLALPRSFDMNDDKFYTYPNRTLCSVLDDMRKCHETRNYSYLRDLVMEAYELTMRMMDALCLKK